MSIKIKTEKVVNKEGIASRKIVSVEGMFDNDKLPKEYTGGRPFVMQGKQGDGILVYGLTDPHIFIGRVLPETQFQGALETIRKSGERLHEINTHIRKLREEWKGEETFII